MTASGSPMTASTSVSTGSGFTTGAFWDNLWRKSGINFVAISVVAYLIYPSQPEVGASPDAVAAFYNAERVRILIAAALAGWNVVNIMWFAAALRTVLGTRARTDGARRRPPPAQRSEGCTSC